MDRMPSFLRPVARIVALAGLSASLGLILPAATVMAQDGGVSRDDGSSYQGRRGRRGPRAGRRGQHRMQRLQRMADELDLSEAQREQVRAVVQQARQARQARRGQGPDPQARHAARRQVREQIQAILTPQQRQRAEQLREQRMDRRLERMADRLELTDSQQAQARTILMRARQERQALRAQDTPNREAMQSLREQTRSSLRDILTPEQQARFDARRDRRGRHGRHGRRGRGARGNR